MIFFWWKVKKTNSCFTSSLRGKRSCHKVSVGEPAQGSFARGQFWVRELWLGGMLGVQYLLAELEGNSWTLKKLGLVRAPGMKAKQVQQQLSGQGMFPTSITFGDGYLWLGHRWRGQRRAIVFVNCRTPWTNGLLNMRCTLESISASVLNLPQDSKQNFFLFTWRHCGWLITAVIVFWWSLLPGQLW